MSNDLLDDSQSGFRAGYSTESALLEVSEYIKEYLDLSTPVMALLLELSSAFDIVSHAILLDRLKKISIIDQAL